jgi:hypothetical protein
VKALAGARVLLLDDNPSEALPVLMAFSKKGVPIAYFDGTSKGLPRPNQRLAGIRLAILDMDLGEGGNDNTIASTLVQRLSKILSPENGPYAILAWTNRPELRDRVTQDIFHHGTVPKPMFTEMLTKAECKLASGEISVHRIARRLKTAIRTIGPLECLQEWEGACFTAATGVTNALSTLVLSPAATLTQWREAWKRETLKLLRAIAEAKAEQQLTAENSLLSFYSALNPLHADGMDRTVTDTAEAVEQHAAEVMAAVGPLTADQKSRLNTMLHLAFHDLRALAAGNIYLFTSNRKPAWAPKAVDLLSGFIQKARVADTETIAGAATPALVEITAACDHAQKKIQVGRFLAGLLMSDAHRASINPRAEFMKELGPFYLRDQVPPGRYYFYFSSRQVLSLPLKLSKKIRAAAKLRNEALADLQAWLAYQVGRQGTMMLK